MTPPVETGATGRADVAICVDDLGLRRFRAALRHWCVGLIDAAVAVRVITPSAEADALTLGSVQVVRHKPLTWPWKRRAFAEVTEAMEDRPPSVVHGFGFGGYPVAAELASTLNADLVLHVLGTHDIERVRAVTPAQVDGVIAASQPLFDRASEAGIIEPDRLWLIRPGVLAGQEVTCFSDSERTPTVLCTHALSTHGGVESLLEAVRILRGRGHEFLTFFTGLGPEENALRRLVRTYGLSGAVTFATPTADWQQIMAGADIFVRPVIEDPISLRVLQSLASGTLTITLGGGVGDACIHDQTAIVCPDDRPSTLAGAIERMLTDPDAARTIAAGGLRHAKQNHSVAAMCSSLLKVYDDLALRARTLSA